MKRKSGEEWVSIRRDRTINTAKKLSLEVSTGFGKQKAMGDLSRSSFSEWQRQKDCSKLKNNLVVGLFLKKEKKKKFT